MVAALLIAIALMALFTVLAVGVASTAAHLFRLLRCKLQDWKHGDVIAGILTAVIIIASLIALPQPKLMDYLLLSIIPMVIYLVFGIMGLVHCYLWFPVAVELLRSLKTGPCPECRCRCCRCGDAPEAEGESER